MSDVASRGANGRLLFETPIAARLAVALPSAAAGAIHLWVVPEHAAESALFGAFFLTVGVLQVLWGALVMAWPARWLLVLGIIGNLAIIALWVVTRTIGVPLGPGAGETEPIGPADGSATFLEAILVVASVTLMAWARRRSVPRRATGRRRMVQQSG